MCVCQEALAQWTKTFIGGGLAKLEGQVQQTAGDFCVGDVITLADAFVLPQVWSAHRFLSADVIKSEYPTLSRIVDRLYGVPEVQRAAPERCPDYCADKAY